MHSSLTTIEINVDPNVNTSSGIYDDDIDPLGL